MQEKTAAGNAFCYGCPRVNLYATIPLIGSRFAVIWTPLPLKAPPQRQFTTKHAAYVAEQAYADHIHSRRALAFVMIAPERLEPREQQEQHPHDHPHI
jgi:hypothetical protein